MAHARRLEGWGSRPSGPREQVTYPRLAAPGWGAGGVAVALVRARSGLRSHLCAGGGGTPRELHAKRRRVEAEAELRELMLGLLDEGRASSRRLPRGEATMSRERGGRAGASAPLRYWVRSSATRAGVATAAVHALRDWAFLTTDLIRLEIVVAIGNLASLRVAEKSGATREGIQRSRLLLHGRAHDAVMYSLTRPVVG